jgi:phosphatidylserine/phosphatidylglycerophosphate/cardiolipin synthase-like enzyme
MNGEGARRDIYVHGKIMLVDDEWATIGSCNLHSSSLSGHTEMNASIWDATVVRPLRRELLSEHLGQDTGHLDVREALQPYRVIAQQNRRKREVGDPAGAEIPLHQHAVDPATKFEPDRTEHANLAKAEAPMEVDRGAIRTVADDGHNLPQSSCFAFGEQRPHQLPTDPSTGPCRTQVDRVFSGMAVSRPRAVGRRVGVTDDLSGTLGDTGRDSSG